MSSSPTLGVEITYIHTYIHKLKREQATILKNYISKHNGSMCAAYLQNKRTTTIENCFYGNNLNTKSWFGVLMSEGTLVVMSSYSLTMYLIKTQINQISNNMAFCW